VPPPIRLIRTINQPDGDDVTNVRSVRLSTSAALCCATMNTELQPGESVIHESRANMQRKAEQVAGRLTLTDRRLVFEPRGLNLHKEVDVFPRDAVVAVTGQWTKFFGFIPLAPRTLVVTLANARELHFIVPRRDAWVAVLAPV
jgi:hypothetical protein